jgi:hypothetical protein
MAFKLVLPAPSSVRHNNQARRLTGEDELEGTRVEELRACLITSHVTEGINGRNFNYNDCS